VTIETGIVQPTPPSLAWSEKLKNAIIDLLFPPHCVACHSPGVWLCTTCSSQIETIHPPVCPRCGLPTESARAAKGSTAVCERCKRLPLQLDGLRGYAFHGGPLRQAIHQFKYKDLRSLASPLGRLMSDGWAALAPADLKVDALVPVPLHPTRQRKRGYNQATLLAIEVGARLERPVVQDVLVRTKATAPQVDLGAQERLANVRDAFRCTGAGLSGKHVMLIDDVCTTGSTLESACAALREAGALSVWAYTLARARPGPHQGVVQEHLPGIVHESPTE
jgi:ComF family protein